MCIEFNLFYPRNREERSGNRNFSSGCLQETGRNKRSFSSSRWENLRWRERDLEISLSGWWEWDRQAHCWWYYRQPFYHLTSEIVMLTAFTHAQRERSWDLFFQLIRQTGLLHASMLDAILLTIGVSKSPQKRCGDSHSALANLNLFSTFRIFSALIIYLWGKLKVEKSVRVWGMIKQVVIKLISF